MRHYVLASHAYFAKGLVSAMELIIGKSENLSSYSGYIDGDTTFVEMIKEEVRKYVAAGEEVIIMTDIFGGSVNNELTELITLPNVHLITGVNLILAMSVILNDGQDDPSSFIPRLIEEAKEGMMYCNMLSQNANNTSEDSLDEF